MFKFLIMQFSPFLVHFISRSQNMLSCASGSNVCKLVSSVRATNHVFPSQKIFSSSVLSFIFFCRSLFLSSPIPSFISSFSLLSSHFCIRPCVCDIVRKTITTGELQRYIDACISEAHENMPTEKVIEGRALRRPRTLIKNRLK